MPRQLSAAMLVTSLLLGAPALAQQQAPAQPQTGERQSAEIVGGEEDARFEIRQSEGGLIRLDKRTGAMSFCTSRDGRLVCRLGADEREAYQQTLASIEDRLKAAEDRIDLLEDRLGEATSEAMKQQDRLPSPDMPTPVPGEDQPADGEDSAQDEPSSPGEEGADEPTPGSREFDRALEFSQRAMRRFFEVIQDMRREMEQEQAQ